MIKKLQFDVALFHRKFGRPVREFPANIAGDDAGLRKRLIEEEARELLEAIDRQDLVEIADGIADLIYVALGTACEFGIDMEPIWDEVQRTNMAKEGGQTRADGKILKPAGWRPPDIHRILQKQKRLEFEVDERGHEVCEHDHRPIGGPHGAERCRKCGDTYHFEGMS